MIAIPSISKTVSHDDWWISLKHGGLLIAPAKLGEFFVPAQLSPLSRYVEDKLRRDVTRLQDGDERQITTLLDTVLEDVLGLSSNFWQKGTSVERDWARQSITREQIKPRRVWLDDRGGVLPVFVADAQDTGGQVARLGIGRGKRAVSRVIEWLRKAEQKVALLTNGYQWRLIHAGADYDAWCEWDINFWFEEGRPGPQVTALRLLLSQVAVQPEQANAPSPLIAAIQASRQGQADLSDVLGERVRKAVELLIRESSLALEELFNTKEINRDLSAFQPPSNRDIYIAASRIVMRCVVILFAEARDLLPRENPIYHNSYGIQGLREQLDRQSGGRASERLRNGFSAWPRLLALFHLVYEGSGHEVLPVPCYGGGLFMPGDSSATDPILRALAALENPAHGPSDAVIYRMLELLCRSRVRVRQGRGSTWVEAPVDFSDLSSEYIGILYEGLLDFELRQAAIDQPMIFLDLGDQPVLPLSRLEGMTDKALYSLLEKLKQKTQLDAAGEDADDDSDEVIDESEAEAESTADLSEEAIQEESGPEDEAQSDVVQELRDRAYQWAIRAVKAGKLVPKPRGQKKEAQEAYEQKVGKMADRLIARIVLPGEWFLVRWGGTRKGSGTFYTRPQLAVPTVQRTLLPLAYDPPVNQAGELDEMAPLGQWKPKAPAIILGLKVCDPACGSASFLIAALRFLVDALWASLFEHGWLIETEGQIRVGISIAAQPDWFVECVQNLPLTVGDGGLTIEQAEEYSKPRLRRYVVERCLYGVDINPLGVELGRLALWVETMDRSLAFSFLDHKVKYGNALVGCWFDLFQDYPVMAWEREAGDKTHAGVHFAKEVWTKKIKQIRNDVVKDELRDLLFGRQLSTFEDRLIQSPEQTHDELQVAVEQIHGAVLNPARQAVDYVQAVQQKQALRQLQWAFDCWCAVWFWSGSDLVVAPTPMQFVNPSPEMKAMVERVAQEYLFFHWEIEFPDVFREKGSGFDAIVGNPPWETLQPNSKEFFSNIDPLYRTYGKQEALEYQRKYFEADSGIEEAWLSYCANFKSLANWNKYVAYAFGDDEITGKKFSLSRKKAEAEQLATEWRNQRAKRKGYSDPEHPFRYQGEGKPYTYKMFTELAHSLTKDGGRFGLIVPSALYTDKGAGSLRKLFLNHCEWTHLYAFQNERFVFSNIHHSFKMVVFSVNKGGCTTSISTRFRLGPGDSPEAQELMTDILDNSGYLSVPAEQIQRFSPNTVALLEVRTDRDLKILEKMYNNGVLLGDDSPQGWGIQYRQGDFNMTSDSKLFPPRPKWEEKGYCPDEYGHWLKGNWQPYSGEASILKRAEGWILSADGTEAIQVEEVEDVALPLYEGRMVGAFDFSRSGWISGKGRGAIWHDLSWEEKRIFPQYLMALDIAKQHMIEGFYRPKTVLMDVTSSINTRTVYSTFSKYYPCGHSSPTLSIRNHNFVDTLSIIAIWNSFVFDSLARLRVGGLHLTWHCLEEIVMPQKLSKNDVGIVASIARLAIPSNNFAYEWTLLAKENKSLSKNTWHSRWARTSYERLRLRCILDALAAYLYELELEDFAWILQDCDYPSKQVCDNNFARTLEPKGFWRVDKNKDPELRHTVLSLIAFHDLKRLGLEAFLNLNDGEGWMLPDTLRLADYGLGHDDRAKTPQPVADRLGPRFLPWQLEGTPAESWAECERHAENLRQLLGDQSTPISPPPKQSSTPKPDNQQLTLIPPEAEQLSIFNFE